jgi:hypothetical protein
LCEAAMEDLKKLATTEEKRKGGNLVCVKLL